MSEFRQASAHVDALEAHIAALQEGISQINGDDSLQETLRYILESTTGDVDAMMEKFRARCSMLDPVTKEPRFGPKMMAKVKEMLRRYDDVKTAVEDEAPLRVQAEAAIKQLLEDRNRAAQEQLAKEREQEEARKAAERARIEEQERLQHEAQAREAEQQRQEQLRVEALAVAASKKREERERQRAELERQQKQEEEERERLNASIPLGKEGLARAIDMLRHSTGSEALYRQSLQKLLAVVTQICASPEVAAFRHIPKDNPHFHADLGQYAGGHQCLLALGFRELQQGDETELRAVFVLEEPDLSEDLDAWSDWFDNLKEMKSLVEAKL